MDSDEIATIVTGDDALSRNLSTWAAGLAFDCTPEKGVTVGTWDRAELQRAHDNYLAVANASGRSGDWRPWAELFTEDAEYIEHLFGRFVGRERILEWIATTMAEWPNNEMTMFPHDWCVCDEERGWWICQIENRFNDPGDGAVYQSANITILKYAGNMQFSSEEDVYNPANFIPAAKAWMEAKKAHAGGGAA